MWNGWRLWFIRFIFNHSNQFWSSSFFFCYFIPTFTSTILRWLFWTFPRTSIAHNHHGCQFQCSRVWFGYDFTWFKFHDQSLPMYIFRSLIFMLTFHLWKKPVLIYKYWFRIFFSFHFKTISVSFYFIYFSLNWFFLLV